MAAAGPLGSLPPSGTFPLHLASSLGESVEPTNGGRKRKRGADPIVGLRYNFKPASITSSTPGSLHSEGSQKQLIFSTPTGGSQVFDAREEAGKARECVLIWDEETNSYTLHPLHATFHLTLNRTASSSTPQTGKTAPAHLGNSSSKRKLSNNSTSPTPASGSAHHHQDLGNGNGDDNEDETEEILAVPAPRATGGSVSRKRPQSSATTSSSTTTSIPQPTFNNARRLAGMSSGAGNGPGATGSAPGSPKIKLIDLPIADPGAGRKTGVGTARASKGGKSLPRKQPPPATATKGKRAAAAGKRGTNSSAAGKKAVKAVPATAGGALAEAKGKFKSAEVIEDSDEEAAAYTDGDVTHAAEEVDEFAKLMGESLAGMDQDPGDDDDDDEEEEEEEEEEDDGSEWL